MEKPRLENPHGINSSCRHCHFYTPQGRRGGTCTRLNVSVMSHWRSCALALPPFAPNWEEPPIHPVLSNYIAPLHRSFNGTPFGSVPTSEEFSAADSAQMECSQPSATLSGVSLEA